MRRTLYPIAYSDNAVIETTPWIVLLRRYVGRASPNYRWTFPAAAPTVDATGRLLTYAGEHSSEGN
jgi:hypothetical protein